MAHQSPSRREILKTAASIGAAAAVSRVRGQAQPASPATAPSQVYYYVDGYHGGVDGHMPPGSLRNVLDGLDRYPQWKVSFEIEPYSWAVFANNDPKSIERLRRFIADPSPAARVEFVSGAYGQPYAWNANGECNIRQLEYGRAELRAVFPELVVDTYAVQEPCWTSCLPQLLKSFGYRRAVLKNSTCWGGYHAAAVDADLVNWIGPDGTAIPAVPRYACERLTGPATTEGAQPTMDFIARCVAAGIKHPAGTTLQDMGWPGRPWRFAMNDQVVRLMRHVTWREYVDTIAAPAARDWKASQDDLRVGLPWGASVLQRIAQVVRLSENQILQAEKIASMALVRRGVAFPAEDLKQAWKYLLWSQHHDVWIVSYNRHRDGTWASAADAKFEIIDRTCRKIVSDSAASMTTPPHEPAPARFTRVFNTTGFRRRELASVEVVADPARRQFHALDARGKSVPCQLVASEDRVSKTATLLFRADVPAMGYTTYKLEALEAALPHKSDSSASATTRADGTVVLETDLYTLSIDPAKGGRIRSLFSKELHREFVDATSPRSFNEFRGYFPTQGQWLTSTDAPAEVKVIEEGPLRVTVRIAGRIGTWPFATQLSLATGRRRIDLKTSFEFPVDSPPFGARRRPQQQTQPQQRVRIGEPWETGRDTTRSNRRPFYDSSFKLQALFPAALHRPTLYKNAPFDVCRTTSDDTRFNAWDAIKNNIVLSWLDLLEEGGAAGMAVMTDHVTAYSMSPGEPLGLVICYAGPGIWVDYGLGRVPRISYSILPHPGDWAKAQLWRELSRWSEPLVTQISADPTIDSAEWSLLDASDGGLEVTTVYRDGNHLLVRLFNPEGDATPRRIQLADIVRRVQLVELDGRVIAELPLERGAGGANALRLTMPRFAVRTLRCTMG